MRIDIRGHSTVETSSRRAEASQELPAFGGFRDSAKEVLALSAELARRDAQITAIYSSHSWRITKPLRWLSVHLLGRPAPPTLEESLRPAATCLSRTAPPTAVNSKVCRLKAHSSGWV